MGYTVCSSKYAELHIVYFTVLYAIHEDHGGREHSLKALISLYRVGDEYFPNGWGCFYKCKAASTLPLINSELACVMKMEGID